MKKGCESQKKRTKKSVELPILSNFDTKKTEINESKNSFWRALSLITVNLLMIAHIIQWKFFGYTISPVEPSETMFTLRQGFVNAGFIFFILAILATLIFGRFFCGWGCHVLALQDFCAWILEKVGLKPKPFRSRLLVFVPLIVALYMFVYPTVIRFFLLPKNETLFPSFTNHLTTTDFWATFPPLWVAIPFLFICGFMTVYFLGSKGFCTYACPYGGFFSLADKITPGKILVNDSCNQCGHCTATCTSNVLVHAEVKEYGMVVNTGCMKCLDCVSVCPNEALRFGFAKPSITVKKTLNTNYSITWTEELFAAVVFSLSFFAVWDVYQIVPMLMALGIAVISTFLVLKTIKLFRNDSQTFYRYSLKTSGKLTKSGWIFLFFSILWIGLNAHSGWIHYQESKGNQAFQSLIIPDELALAQKNPAQWISQTDRQNIVDGQKHFELARNYGFLTNNFTLPKLAWLEFLLGNPEKSVDLLGLAVQNQSGQEKALSYYYRGAIQNRLGKYQEAVENFNNAVKERPDLVLALEQKGESLWLIGEKEEAISVWNDANKLNPNLPLTNNFLSAANRINGNSELADKFEKQAEKNTPNEPFFIWMLGLRLQNLGMNDEAEKHFQRAIQINPEFRKRKTS